ncbi:MAG TPA: hypothetical protein VN843_29315 [Anaerolineales bacterium]|nr:hypothetical protein [Anaerolineales bacterium]
MPEPVVYTTSDKAKRDELWRELRTRGRGVERLAVRFSGVELVKEETVVVRTGYSWIKNPETGKRERTLVNVTKAVPTYQSTWSVSHPAEIDTLGGE